MVVAGSDVVCRILVHALRAGGVETLVTVNGSDEALKLFEQDIGLVIAEWTLPGNDGIALLRSLKAREECSDLPVMIVSGRSGRDDVREALDAGARDYLLKPFAGRSLHEKVQRLLAAGSVDAAAA